MSAAAKLDLLARVPDLKGRSLSIARSVATQAGVQIETVLFEESQAARNTVVGQAPCAGTMVARGDVVTITVSQESLRTSLPSILRQSNASDDGFLSRFLWLIQHQLGSIEDQLETVSENLDPAVAPRRFLLWLGSWIAAPVNEDTSETEQRQTIRNRVAHYRSRGTVRGLRNEIAAILGEPPKIVEQCWPLKDFRIGVNATVAIDTVVLPPTNPAHCFVVELPPSASNLSTSSLLRIHQAIAEQKPAHTTYYLRHGLEDQPNAYPEILPIGLQSPIGAQMQEEPLHFLHEEKNTAAVAESVVSPTVPRADNAPIEGNEVRTNLAGGFEHAAREMAAISKIEERT